MKEQIIVDRIINASIDINASKMAIQFLKRRYKQMIWDYFRAHTDPWNGNGQRINPDDPAHSGVIAHTNPTYTLLSVEKRKLINAQKRHHRATIALLKYRGVKAA